jgi:hypothetical protein
MSQLFLLICANPHDGISITPRPHDDFYTSYTLSSPPLIICPEAVIWGDLGRFEFEWSSYFIFMENNLRRHTHTPLTVLPLEAVIPGTLPRPPLFGPMPSLSSRRRRRRRHK